MLLAATGSVWIRRKHQAVPSKAFISPMELRERLASPIHLRVHYKAAIDIDTLSCHIIGALRSQKDCHIGYIFRRLPAVERDDPGDLFGAPGFVIYPLLWRQILHLSFPHTTVEWCGDHTRV